MPSPPDNVRPVSDEAIARACALLRSGQLVAFPTETVYGLGADATSEGAVRRIYAAKGRPSNNPLIVHAADEAGARALAAAWPEAAAALAARFWPGPLTLVLPRGPLVSPLVSAGRETVALRVPAHPVALRLLRACGLPLAAPSANPSERLSPTTAEHVRRGLPELPLILDGGPCRLGLESTVLDLTGSPPRLLRPGALPLLPLRALLPDLAIGPAPQPDGAALPSPGLLARHYAPRARLLLCDDIEALDLGALPAPVGLLLCDRDARELTAGPYLIERLPDDAAGYGADLYAALHRLDDRGAATIVARRPPPGDEWAAVADRLQRASA